MSIIKHQLATHTQGSEYPSFARAALAELRDSLEPAHSNAFFQILILEEGEGRYFVGLEQFSIVAPCVCFIFPRQISSLALSAEARGQVLMFDESIFCSAILSQELREYNVDLYQKVNYVAFSDKQAQFAEICDMVQHIASLARPLNNIRQIELKFLVKIIIFKIIDAVADHAFAGVQDSDLDTYLSFRKLIDERYSQLRKVEQYCQLLAITAKKLNSLCKKYAHNTALELIHDRLSLEIKKRLIFEDAPLKEIAYELGFESQSALNKFIAAKFSCSPSQLKSKLRQENTMISSLSPEGE